MEQVTNIQRVESIINPTLKQEDLQYIDTLDIPTTLNPVKDVVEIHFYDLTDALLESDHNYKGFKEYGNAYSTGDGNISFITLSPVSDCVKYGFEEGGIKVQYNFFRNLFYIQETPVEFILDSISEDGKEIEAIVRGGTVENFDRTVEEVRSDIFDRPLTEGIKINFFGNRILICSNIGVSGEKVKFRLYEPLPVDITERSLFRVHTTVSEPVCYEVETATVPEVSRPAVTLRAANFSVNSVEASLVSTEYMDLNELFQIQPDLSSTGRIYSLIKEKGIDLNIDHTNFINFIHFSSAEERLRNFKYKLSLLQSYSASIEVLNLASSGRTGISGSRTYYNGLTEGVLNSFDHYERFLFYESGSDSWPKISSEKPYINQEVTSVESQNWFSSKIEESSIYDQNNSNSLVYTVPGFIREDDINTSYLTFVSMVGQHFDLLFNYTKAVTEKYNSDNRTNRGLPKELVGEVLKNFGIKLYNSSKTVDTLYNMFSADSFPTGSEVINTFVTGSISGSGGPVERIPNTLSQFELQKRIYHNLPNLIKGKGTERGIRTLINCFGIPSSILTVKTYGGVENNGTVKTDYGAITSSYSKIRLDNTGSFTSSVIGTDYKTAQEVRKYSDDLHRVEVGFSPTDNIENYLISSSLLDGFVLDNYIGDPRLSTETGYESLEYLSKNLLEGLERFEVGDYVRILKFFDNQLFKMVRDFLPARTVVDTGLVIKPYFLSRSKIKNPSINVEYREKYLTGSIDMIDLSGTHGSTFGSATMYDTSYVKSVQTPTGIGTVGSFLHQEAKFNGIFSGSNLEVTDGKLTDVNPFVSSSYYLSEDNLTFISASTSVCSVGNTNSTIYVVLPNQHYNSSYFFTGIPVNAEFYLEPGEVQITDPFNFTTLGFNQSDVFGIKMVDPNINPIFGECSTTVNCFYGECSIGVRQDYTTIALSEDTNPSYTSNILTEFFNVGSQHSISSLVLEVYKNGVLFDVVTGTSITSYTFQAVDYDNSDTVVLTLYDVTYSNNGINCGNSVTLTIALCTIEGVEPQGTQGTIGKFTQFGPYGILWFNSPVHNSSFQYEVPFGEEFDMRLAFNYLQNPNPLFEDSSGTALTNFPELSGRELGLASFFTGLGNLNDIHYEVNIYRMQDLSDFTSTELKYCSADIFLDTDYYWSGPSVTNSGAIKPGLRDSTRTFIDPYTSEVTEGVFWSYDTPVPDVNGQPQTGYIAKLYLDSLFKDFKFGERLQFPIYSICATQGGPRGYRIDMFAYSTGLDGDVVCVGSVSIIVENWIIRNVPCSGGTSGGA